MFLFSPNSLMFLSFSLRIWKYKIYKIIIRPYAEGDIQAKYSWEWVPEVDIWAQLAWEWGMEKNSQLDSS